METPNEPPPPYPVYPGPDPSMPEKEGHPQPGYPGYPTPGQYSPPGQNVTYPPGEYPQAQLPQQHSTVVINQPPLVATTTILHPNFRETPVRAVCPSCNAHIVTAIDFEVGTCTYLVCAILCLVGCYAGCCFIPFCMDNCKDIRHICPNCRATVGNWNKAGNLRF